MQLIQSMFSGGLNRMLPVPVWLSVGIDVIIVSYGIFKIMSWIRKTRAWSLFKGFMVLLAVYAAASLLRLDTILWAMRYIFNVGLIALVVLFQPELRRALEQMGKGRFLNSFGALDADRQFTEHSIDEIVNAAQSMSKIKMGALIVIERDIALGDFELTGVPIDATVSCQLLLNIFENKTPLHDGAVIIKKNRIAAASCILPLSPDEIDGSVGTRHRAAVGTSEVSDALIIVVSEETGIISVALANTLSRNLNGELLRNMLNDILLADKKKQNGWRIRLAKKDR